MLRSVLAGSLLLATLPASAQVIPAARRTQWELAGAHGPLPVTAAVRTLDLLAFGAIPDGRTPADGALQQALAALGPRRGIIQLPAGTLLFRGQIVLPDSVVLRGRSADSTTLRFNLRGAPADLISLRGTLDATATLLAASAMQGGTALVVPAAAAFQAGDWLLLTQNDSALVTSSWAYGSVGQVVRVVARQGNRLELASPLRKDFTLADRSRVRRLRPRHQAGLECLRIVRTDVTGAQTSHVAFTYATDCWVRGVESDSCNQAHVAASFSSNLSIAGSYFHRAFAYGTGGQGYGVLLQFASGECLVEDNTFDRMRHSVLVQAGANGNVVAYNSSTDPTQASAPTNLVADLVLHGNYPFQNLFEGNLAQTIVVDNSHGANGPFNTFFRNRADLFGLSVSAATSGYQNFVGNEITNMGLLLGNYLLTGPGQLASGNYVRGAIMPAGTGQLMETSCYLTAAPSFFGPGLAWPVAGWPMVAGTGTLPARLRLAAPRGRAHCETRIALGLAPATPRPELAVVPNPATTEVRIPGLRQPVRVELISALGQRVATYRLAPGARLRPIGLPPGVYSLVLFDGDRPVGRCRLVWAP